MIEFHFKSDLVLQGKTDYSDWITRILESESFVAGQIDYIFCTDDYLLELNKQYLNHDTLTDIITFDYTKGKTISGDVFISTERVEENANSFGVTFENELLRVMAHGLLHLMGYGDKVAEHKAVMRQKEEEKIKMFHVEQ
ncbi:rRNA maturation RNase YbeY [Flagellimonas taeanensis]|uniref:Endoribonuclease YbeY n=1 Tax=Flagellimonas taeanensis TaxID=1005926 RepID=A0A1M6QA99_9FLAO|nr:rRNA maturation RNase YbeY [Allomuricauda taeanensis]MEE1961586.1 rRNA maturation RNase YbeY [Allomuricauda taeanensis]SFB69826.1 rRNA maturation RNase YbeY [Allomuricauda taeanensis]SHK17086.1 rRNA maturation RNase YbeY [Allomuricauda taeanensis]